VGPRECYMLNSCAPYVQKAPYGLLSYSTRMCRSIKCLANFEPPATESEIREAAVQFVRKLSGATRPSRANEAAFERAVDEVTDAANRLIHSLSSQAPPRDRAVEAQKARERSLERYGQKPAVAGVSR
jgi:hypothetical protein